MVEQLAGFGKRQKGIGHKLSWSCTGELQDSIWKGTGSTKQGELEPQDIVSYKSRLWG